VSGRAAFVLAAMALAFGCDAPPVLQPDDFQRARVPVAPPAPTGLSAVAVAPDRVSLSWKYRGGTGTEVRIERSLTDTSNYEQIAATAAGEPQYLDSGVEGGRRYWYRVRACSGGVCSGYSNEVAVTTPAGAPPLDPWTVLPVAHNLTGVSGVSEWSVMALGSGVALKFDGANWSNITGNLLSPAFGAAWAATESALYGLELCGPVRRHDGVSWSTVGPAWQLQAPEDLEDPRPFCWYYWDLWGPSPHELFLVGEFGQAAYYDGAAWSAISPGPFNVFTDELHGVWGTSGTDVFVVGGDLWGSQRAAILHYDGLDWTHMVSSDDTDLPVLRAVWGSASDNVFAVGRSGTIVRFDGAQWSAMDTGTSANLQGVWGSAADNVYAVGGGGTLLHFNGTDWSTLDSGTSANLASVWVSESGVVFAVGNGVIVYGTP
jgi:hypothetical protein